MAISRCMPLRWIDINADISAIRITSAVACWMTTRWLENDMSRSVFVDIAVATSNG